ncbi:MAG: DUF1822 family protein [Geitlerinemataceae cyanobacterium]
MMMMMSDEDLLFGLETQSADTIDLDRSRVERAIELSQRSIDDGQQWQTYLHALALFGTQQWLEEREPELSIEIDRCSLFQPLLASPIDAICNVRVGNFKLCILTAGSILEEEIFIPRAAIDLPQFAAHFYVLAEVCEELEQVNIRGFLRYDRLVEQQTTVNLQLQEDWTYAVPLTEFESDADRLLLYLRCLAPEAILLPATASIGLAELSRLRDELTPVLPQLQSARHPWWQILTWQQAAAILAHPELLENSNPPVPDTQTSPAWGKQVSQPIINTAMWLRDELDRWAQEAAWILLPPLSPASSGVMRSINRQREAVEELEWMLQQLQRKGTIVATQTYSAYQDFQLGNLPLRLYAVTWEVSSSTGEPEWTLLLILSGILETSMPSGTMLQVSDETGLCAQCQQPKGSRDSPLYVRMVGSWNETFLAAVSLPTGETRTFPPFGFQPDLGKNRDLHRQF